MLGARRESLKEEVMRPTLVFIVVFFLYCSSNLPPAASLSRPGCPNSCGNVSIPYPFGVGSECSVNSSFIVICRNSTTPSTPFLSSINMELLNVSLETGTVRVKQPVSPLNCSSEQRGLSLGSSLLGSSFTISPAQNSIALLGCRNTILLIENSTAIRGCAPVCNVNSNDTSCNGINCCQTTIPGGRQELQFELNRTRSESSNGTRTCGYAFLAERTWFQEDYLMYRGLHDDLINPFDEGFRFANVVLDWGINLTPLSTYSSCRNLNSSASSSRVCSCNRGFKGNPYLHDGCQDINECDIPNVCIDAACVNIVGSYRCRSMKRASFSIGIFSSIATLVLLIGAVVSYRFIRKKIKARRKKKYFTRNGGLLLEQHLSSADNGVEKTKLFTAKELTQATDHYNENRVLGRGGQGTVYKGMLKDGRIVAVKKSKKVNPDDIQVFINEVAILSQINHRHIVKLMGCCLETEVPLLVYEFIPNGTLFEHIHHPNEDFVLTWEMRVRIATEVARAVAYLHSSASLPIYHRDIKTANILLDEKYRAKVADFGTSRSVSLDQTHLTTRVLGTFGYLDPEYFQSGKFTDKSDVYSFGVVIIELLTGEKAVSLIRAEEGRSLISYFLQAIEEDQLFDIIDPMVLQEGNHEHIMTISKLARRCLHLTGKKRPTMREVAVELERIQISIDGSSFVEDVYEDRDFPSIEMYDAFDTGSSSTTLDISSTSSFLN